MRNDEARVRKAFNAVVGESLTEAERVRLARALVADVVDSGLEGILDPTLCVAEGQLVAAKLAMEPAELFLQDHSGERRHGMFEQMQELADDDELPE